MQRLLVLFEVCIITLSFCVIGAAAAAVNENVSEIDTDPLEHHQGQHQRQQRRETLEFILAEDHEIIDPTLPNTIQQIKKRGGHRCWHKHSTFLDHLLGVHNILRLWGEDEITGRVGLLHSAYSNSYVNLALFDPNVEEERSVMKGMIGVEAEELVYLFCIIDRQAVVVNTLLADGSIPKEGLNVPHLRDNNVSIYLSPKILRLLVIFTMADVADQYFGWQDELFGGMEKTNSMLLPGHDDEGQHHSASLWPGSSRPGLWMSYVSQLGRVATTFESDDDDDISESCSSTTRTSSSSNSCSGPIPIPPVFDNCTRLLTREDEAKAIDLYWSVVMNNEEKTTTTTIATLEKSIEYNPWFFESHVMLAQKYLHMNDNENARVAAERALELQEMWGTSYDKRMSFPAWVAWTRVLHQRAVDGKGWPDNSWEVNNFGMVR